MHLRLLTLLVVLLFCYLTSASPAGGRQTTSKAGKKASPPKVQAPAASPSNPKPPGSGSGSNVKAPAPAAAPPPACTPSSPSAAQLKSRQNAFANALFVQKDLNSAFRYVSANYINHHAGVGNGNVAAFTFLNNLNWSKASISVKKLAVQGAQSWADYTYAGKGEIVDRFRWESGCVVEHWDSGQSIPAGVTITN